MDEIEKLEETGDVKPTKLMNAVFDKVAMAAEQVNPYILESESDDKYGIDEYNETLDSCRFYYKTEPLMATVINKLVDLGINKLVFSKNGLSDNEFKVFTALEDRLLEFSALMAREYLISGLVVPAISYGRIAKDEIKEWGIKKYDSLVVPKAMFVRDPATLRINQSPLSDQPSYFAIIPEYMIAFIKNKGKYPDGKEDTELYKSLLQYFPDFVKAVNKGETEILLDGKTIIRSIYLSNSPYPIPYGMPALIPLQQKRALRRMDYSLIQKIMRAILHIKLGSDNFPVTDSDEDVKYIENLRAQLNWRYTSKTAELERLFQLITNHTVELNWVYPNTETLLNDAKYNDINKEILYALGFPRVLISGETEKSNTSDPELATISPIKTMESFRRKLIRVIRVICAEVARQNSFKTPPDVEFGTLNMHQFQAFVEALSKLYDTGGLSRQSFAEYLGYDFFAEAGRREEEQKILDASGVPQVGANPFGGTNVQQPTNNAPKKQDKTPNDNQPTDVTNGNN